MRSISEIVARFKANWTAELAPDAIAQACRDAGMSWNDSFLNPIVTIQIFFVQVLHGNAACQHLPHLTGLAFTAAAYCSARQRVALSALRLLLARCVDQLQQDHFHRERWQGHRVFHVDGSSFSMADTRDLRAHFGQPGGQLPGCGFPTAHWLVQLHAGTGMIVNMLAGPLRTHDMSQVASLHPELQRDDVLVADRGFCSYGHFALLLQRGVHGLLRVHQRMIVDFTPGRAHVAPRAKTGKGNQGKPTSRWIMRIGETDQIVAWQKPVRKPEWMTVEQFATLPEEIELRELRYTVRQPGFRPKQITLITTLLDVARYPLLELAELYRQRWEIETNFGHLKTTMKMDVLKCQTVAGVLRELHVFALIYNLVRQVMLAASMRQQVDVRRISFIDALRWLQTAMPGEDLPTLAINPHRPNRVEPRVKKRRPKDYSLMKKPRRQLKKELAGA